MKSNSVTIEKASVNDWKLYKEIRLDTLKNEPQAFSSTYKEALLFTDEKWKALLSDKDNCIFLVKNNDQVIGTARIAYNDIDETDDIAVLCGKYIKKEFRGYGIGRELENKRLEEISKHKNIKTIRGYIKENNQPNINLLTSLRFIQVGVKDGELVMEKSNN